MTKRKYTTIAQARAARQKSSREHYWRHREQIAITRKIDDQNKKREQQLTREEIMQIPQAISEMESARIAKNKATKKQRSAEYYLKNKARLREKQKKYYWEKKLERKHSHIERTPKPQNPKQQLLDDKAMLARLLPIIREAKIRQLYYGETVEQKENLTC